MYFLEELLQTNNFFRALCRHFFFRRQKTETFSSFSSFDSGIYNNNNFFGDNFKSDEP